MIEVLVAVLVVVIGALATFGLLSDAIKNTARAKGTQVALDRAQQEIEALRSLSNKQLAMTATPESSTDSLNPNYRVSAGRFALLRQPPSSSDPIMVVNTGELYGGGAVKGGIVNPGPTSFSSGDVSGKIYRYVVWRNDEKCGSGCPGGQDFKQIIVAVKLDTPGNQSGERGYVEVQSDFVDPTDSPEQDPLPASDGKVVTAQQFFLTDTPCSSSGTTTRQTIGGDHLLHNTLGTCANGPKTGGESGAPDALLLGGPPDPAPEDPDDPALYDYSSDSYLEPSFNADKDKGLQIRRDEKATGCLYDPAKGTASLHPESQMHRWVTDPFSAGFTLTGQITLEFYTRSINEALHKGTLCVYLYKRDETVSPPEDAILANAKGGAGYWTYTPPVTTENPNGYWPSSEWGRVRLTMDFISPPYTIPAGDRLGVALSVERGNTPADAIQIMYDHPKFPARIEVDTNTPLEGG
jgi:type II secretory pathway pseudopilin PulG